MASLQDRPTRAMRVTAVATLVLAVVFYVFFDVEKHTPALVAVNPFLDDPYDAIGSFGIQAALVCAALGVLRAFGPTSPPFAPRAPFAPRLLASRAPATERAALLVRAQLAAALAVVITMLGDVVAMARHPTVWLGSGAGYVLAALVGGLLILAVLVCAAIARAAPGGAEAAAGRLRARAIVVSLVALLVLAIYPEDLARGTAVFGAVLTVMAGVVLLFVPLWAVVTGIVPNSGSAGSLSVARWLMRYWYVLGVVVLVGLAVGLAVFAREGMVEGVPRDVAKVAHVALVFMGLEAAGVLIGFTCLGGPLGLLPTRGHA